MEQVRFILRITGILFMPIVLLLLSAVIWQNNGTVVAEFLLVGNWWQLENVNLSSLLLGFLLLGMLLICGFFLLLHSERKLRRALAELRQIKKQGAPTSGAVEKTNAPAAPDTSSKEAVRSERKAGKAGASPGSALTQGDSMRPSSSSSQEH